MTPYELGVILHYHWSPNDHPDIVRRPPVWFSTMDDFTRQGLLLPTTGGATYYKISARGRAFVAALQQVPLPTPTWQVVWPVNPTLEAR